jgi:hypothetical protein
MSLYVPHAASFLRLFPFKSQAATHPSLAADWIFGSDRRLVGDPKNEIDADLIAAKFQRLEWRC